MGPTKAPGPDGFPVMFYQKHWAMLGVTFVMRSELFFSGEDVPKGLCDTVIVLIAKKLNPERLTNFQPISLCNVLYKIASKVLTNWLKGVLPSIIAEEQSAFIPRILITDNVLIAYECMHTIRRQQAKRHVFALKIDMMKAYDRVEWRYLEGVLQKMRFKQGWINSVMRCVTSARYSVKVNGELTEPFIPTRGIRQGDPISPYLFLLCAEGLSCLVRKEEQADNLKGVRNGIMGLSISHLLFADDTIFFTRAHVKCINSLNFILQTYNQGI
jgi:hypothetical protein